LCFIITAGIYFGLQHNKIKIANNSAATQKKIHNIRIKENIKFLYKKKQNIVVL